ncbi:MAG: DUF3592 domain-containing protein [Treponema sp.]|nr:DUF3592 domain-containing protein [Treponema sp.]
MAVFLLFLGIALFAMGIRTVIKTIAANKEFKENGIPVTARFHGSVKRSQSFAGMRTLWVDVAFQTKDNETIITELVLVGNYHSRHNVRIGQKIDILYNKDNPQKVHVANPVHAYVASVISIVCGLAFIIIGIIAMSRKEA